jgi:hypothetical protein
MTDNVEVTHLKVTSDRNYYGLYHIEGAPFRISFWTIATDIDPVEGVRRLRFADELVAAWNTLAATASNAAMVEAYHHHLSEVCAECYAGEGTDAFLAAMEFLSKRDKERCPDLFENARAKASEVQP